MKMLLNLFALCGMATINLSVLMPILFLDLVSLFLAFLNVLNLPWILEKSLFRLRKRLLHLFAKILTSLLCKQAPDTQRITMTPPTSVPWFCRPMFHGLECFAAMQPDSLIFIEEGPVSRSIHKNCIATLHDGLYCPSAHQDSTRLLSRLIVSGHEFWSDRIH